MVAGLFAQHGAWCGICREGDRYNPAGYFENKAIKLAMIDAVGRNFTGKEPEPVEGWADRVELLIRRQGYESGIWFFKAGAFYHRIWEALSPMIIKVRRPTADIYESYKRCNFLPSRRYTPEDISYIIGRQVNTMNALSGFDIHSKALAAGDHADLIKAFHATGLDYDEKITDKFINSRLFTT